ncbi:MAG: TIM barrel protein [Anaerolineae bacterium]|nr:TIM barrel protein [Anaerolineae bacterium]
MRFSTMTFSYEPGSLDSICQEILQQSFHLVDLAAGHKHQVDKYSAVRYPVDEAARVRKVLSTYHLEISEVFLLHFDTPINHPDPKRREMMQKAFTGFAEFCYHVGAESIMMSPGKIFTELGEQDSRQLAAEELRYQREVCDKKGLQLNIEPHWHSLAETPKSARWFCEQVPGIGLTLDYSHFIAQGYTQDEIEPLHSLANHFHARQAKPGATNASLADGVIDFDRIMQKFISDGWDGVVCLEYNPALIADAPEEINLLKRELKPYILHDVDQCLTHTPAPELQWNRIVFDPDWCRTCKLCEMVCSISHEGEARPSLARIQIAFDAFTADNPIKGSVCAQCLDAPCISACPVDAMSRYERTGAVVVDQDLCIGCMACRRACPWDIPQKHPELKIATKCDLCGDREDGPLCVEMCPLSGKALRFVRTTHHTVGLEVT